MSPESIVDCAYRESIQILRRNSTPHGFVAASSTEHYAAIWARDAFITALGANLSGDGALMESARRSVAVLAARQGPLGQVPNAFWPARQYWDWGEAGCVDGTALLVIAAADSFRRSGDRAFLESVWPNLEAAFRWLCYQDANNSGLISSPEAADWMDSSLNRSGRLLYVNVLYYWAARCMRDLARELEGEPGTDPEAIKERINLLFWPTDAHAYDRLMAHIAYPASALTNFPHPASVAAHRRAIGPRCYYLAHLTWGQAVDVCDVLANLLAILTGVADSARAAVILDYLREAAIDAPFPVRCWPEPLQGTPDSWGMLKPASDAYQGELWRNPPYSYHNAGIWPFIGGFYVAALVHAGRTTEAERVLERLAGANQLGVEREWEFREWLHGQTGEPRGAAYQSWNAGTYVLAYRSVCDGPPGW